MKLSSERQGDIFILSSSAFWGTFPVITILSYNNLYPLISLTLSSLFAAIFFALNITVKKTWRQLFDKSIYKEILLATFFIGILYYLLVFFALQMTTPGNTSIVGLTQTLFSFLFFHVFRKDYIPRQHIIGSILMTAGAFIVLSPNLQTFNLGDMLVLVSSAVAPFGNFYTQKARQKASSEVIMFVRSLVSAVVIFLIALVLRNHFSPLAIKQSLFFLIINGVFLLGFSKSLWIEGIHRISVTKANALSSSVSPLITLLLAWAILHVQPTLGQLFALVPICVGIILLGKKQEQQTV